MIHDLSNFGQQGFTWNFPVKRLKSANLRPTTYQVANYVDVIKKWANKVRRISDGTVDRNRANLADLDQILGRDAFDDDEILNRDKLGWKNDLKSELEDA